MLSTTNSQINGVGGNNGMMEMIKQMLTMNLLSQTMNNKESSSNGSLPNMVYTFIMMAVIDFIMKNLPQMISFICEKINKHLSKQLKKAITLEDVKKVCTSKIVLNLKLTPKKGDMLTAAIFDLISNYPETKSVSYIDGIYSLNYTDPIHINSDIVIQLADGLMGESIITPSSQEDGPVQKINIFSYTLNMRELRNYLSDLQENYRAATQNNLGTSLYFFDEITNGNISGGGNNTQYNSALNVFTYNIQQFSTNRRFDNLFGPEIKIIRKRVEFFIANKAWYDKKGIPYTLGLLLSGAPGTGKTSLIKCLANITNRYIINVNLHENITKTQMHNLFYNETINVVRNGRNEQFVVPINKRIYVFDDVDCQSDDLIVDRMIREQEKIDKAMQQKEEEEDDDLELLPKYMGNPSSSLIDKAGNPTKNANKMIIDKMSTKNLNAMVNNESKITLAYLLNLLDGVVETPGRILIMAANYIERIDKALIRPGRIDTIARFNKCTNETICEITEHFFEQKLTNREREIINSFEEYKYTPAEISKIMFEHIHNFDEAFNELILLLTTSLTDPDITSVVK